MSAIGKPLWVDRTPVSDRAQPQGIGISRTAPETRFGLSTSCRLPVTPRDTDLLARSGVRGVAGFRGLLIPVQQSVTRAQRVDLVVFLEELSGQNIPHRPAYPAGSAGYIALGISMTTREATLVDLGETLIVLQKVERFLAAVLMHMAAPAEVDGKLEKVLLRDKNTLGQLLTYFGSRVELPSNFETELDALLEDRNIFVHNLFMQSWFDLNTPEGCIKLTEFMRALRSGARTATKVMMASLKPEESDSSRLPEAQAYINRVFARVEETAHPEVRARVNDQYIEGVRQDALSNFSVGRRNA